MIDIPLILFVLQLLAITALAIHSYYLVRNEKNIKDLIKKIDEHIIELDKHMEKRKK